MDTNKKYKIIFTDYSFSDIEIERQVLEELDCEIVELQTKDEEKLYKQCKDADALIVETAQVNKKILDNMSKCKVISRYGIGVDSIDIEAASKKGIKVCNVSDYCLDEVADHSLALILSLGRKIIRLNDSVKTGAWDAVPLAKPLYNFKKSVLGIIGFGKIPQNLYPKVLPLFKDILVYDPYIGDDLIRKYNLHTATLYEIVRSSDFISIYCPLTEDTYHMFDQREFQLMKPMSFIINTSRGSIINTKALYSAIINKQIAGAGLDVLEEEPPGMENELLKLDNVIITPHAAYYSESSLEDLKYKAALNVLKILKGDKPVNVINAEV